MTEATAAPARRPSSWKPTPQNPERCRWAREQAGLTLTGAAAQLGISAGYLSEIETGSRSASVIRQQAMAKLYGREPRELGRVIDGRNVHDKPAD